MEFMWRATGWAETVRPLEGQSHALRPTRERTLCGLIVDGHWIEQREHPISCVNCLRVKQKIKRRLNLSRRHR